MSSSDSSDSKSRPSPEGIREGKNAVRIDIDQETAGGVYANLTMINHSRWEFVLDFIFMQPQRPQGTVRSRVITSPAHFKRLVSAMSDNLARYEREFGPIPLEQLPEPPDPSTLN